MTTKKHAKTHDESSVAVIHLAPSQDVEKSLSAIYQDESGQMPDMTKLAPRPTRWWTYAITAAALFVAVLTVAAWAGFSFFKPFRGFTGQGLAITMEGPEGVSLGQETTYFINYQNVTSKPVESAEIRVTFPTDFTVISAEPAPTSDGAWRLGSMPVDGRGTLKIRGVFTGALGTVTAVQVVGHYRLSGVSSDMDVLATKVLRYADSVLQGSLTVPVKVLPGDKAELVYRIENRGTEPVQDLEARIALPEGFQPMVATGTQSLSGRTLRASLGVIAGGASTTVAVRGAFASGVSGEAHVVAEAGRLTPDGAFLASQRSETSFTVLAGDLALKVVMNGADAEAPIAYGSRLRFGLQYENTSSEELKDVVLRLRFESATGTIPKGAALVDWKGYEDSASGTRKGDVLTWDKKQIPELAKLAARDIGTIDVDLHAVPSASGTADLAARAVLEATVASVGDAKVNRVIQAAPIVLTYLTDATLAIETRYFSEEGAPYGSGPLPPQVGERTTYRVRWIVAKRFHELKDLTVTAALPKIASWPGNATSTAGAIAYDAATRTVTWSLNRLPSDMEEVVVDFDVAITPTDADADRFAQLLGETRFEATDAHVNRPIARTRPALTTDLQQDENAQGKGVVRK